MLRFWKNQGLWEIQHLRSIHVENSILSQHVHEQIVIAGAQASDIECPTKPDFPQIWKFVKNLIKNYISENLIKKYIDIFAVFKITKKILKNYFKNTDCTASRCRWYLKCNVLAFCLVILKTAKMSMYCLIESSLM